MPLQDRFYGGKIFRPTPKIFITEDESLLIIATAWGATESAQKVITLMSDYLQAAKNDLEVTTPFEYLSCLSNTCNHLRIASLLANDMLYRDDNQDQYRSGVELFAAVKKHSEISFVQLGSSNAFLLRPQMNPIPLTTGFDLSSDLSQGEYLPPLPANMLGLDTTCNLQISSFKAQPTDQILLINRSFLTTDFWGELKSDPDLAKISQSFALNEPDMPFWLGLHTWSF